MNKLHVLLALIFVLAGIMEPAAREQVEPQTLAIGAKAPGFRLKGVDDKYYTIESFSKADILLIVFSAPHCPTAQAYEERIIAIQKEYGPKGVQVVKIMPNHLIEAIDPEWKGNLPYTIIIEPGGKIVHRFAGGLKMLDFRQKIVEHPMIGRYF